MKRNSHSEEELIPKKQTNELSGYIELFWNLQEHIFSTLTFLLRVCLMKPVKEKARVI